LGGWISRHPLLAGGGFGSGIFLLVGLIGTLVFLPGLRVWFAAADWPTTEAEITASRLVYGISTRAARPDFTFRYEWKGRTYTAQGYDLLNAYATGGGVDNGAVLAAHPVGSRVLVLVNPGRPSQAVLIRGTISGLILQLVPPLFFLVGLLGLFFTVITARGWFDENSRHPLGRGLRTAGGWLVKEKIMKPLLFLIFGGVILGFAVAGVVFENGVLVVFAAVMAWGVWRAARPQPAGGSKGGEETNE